MTTYASPRSYRHIHSLRFDPSKSNYKFIRRLCGSRSPNGTSSRRSASSSNTSRPNTEFPSPSALGDRETSSETHTLETQFRVNLEQQPQRFSSSLRAPRSRSSRPRAHTTATVRPQTSPGPGVRPVHRSTSYHVPPQESPAPETYLPALPRHHSQPEPQEVYHCQQQNESMPQQPSFLVPSFEHLFHGNSLATPSFSSQPPFAFLSNLPHFDSSGGSQSATIGGSLLGSQGYQTGLETYDSSSSPVPERDNFVELFKRYEAEDNPQHHPSLQPPQQPVQPEPAVPEPYISGHPQYQEHVPPVQFQSLQESQHERQFQLPMQTIPESRYQAQSSLSYPEVHAQPVLPLHDPNIPQQQQHFSSSQQHQNAGYGTHYDQNDSSAFLCHIPEIIPESFPKIGIASSVSKSRLFDGIPPFPSTPHLFAKSDQQRSLAPYTLHRAKNATFPLPEGLWDDVTDEPRPELKDFL